MTRTGTKTKEVVQGTEASGLFPTTRGELRKRLVLDGRTEPFDVHGGAYAREVRTMGTGTVRGPILTGENARLEVETPGIQRLLGGVSAPGEVTAAPVEEALTELVASPAASPEGIRFVIRGDVAAGQRVSLKNALVLGSVKAPSVRLESSIVLGRITALRAPGELHAICSTFGIYETRRVIMEGPTSILVAAGSSDEEPELLDHQPVDGERVYPFSMRLLSLCRHKKIGCGLPNSALTLPNGVELPEGLGESPGIACAYWLHGTCPFHDSVALGRADFIRGPEAAGQQAHGAVNADLESAARTEGGPWLLGLQSRAQNLPPLVESDAFFDSALHRVFAYEHLSEHARGQLHKDLEGKRLSEQESTVLKLTIDHLDD